ncbi:MAG TPA: flagellar basal body-associated FliL family protein [Solirubrobacteraceae bacterium]|jgi:flagellar FliL protein
MLKNKKMLVLALPILLFGAYTMTKHKPVVKQKIQGNIYVMPGSFLLNLSDGRYVKLTMALDLAPGQSDGASAEGGGAASGESTIGTLPEEAVIREIVTNLVTGMSGDTLISNAGRRTLKHQILLAIRSQTDIKLEDVLIPDFTVQ